MSWIFIGRYAEQSAPRYLAKNKHCLQTTIMDPPAVVVAAGDLPNHRAQVFFDRAKDLNLAGGTSSIEQERILRDLFKAVSLQPDHIPHYMFLGKVFRQALDITSAIFCYRLVLNLQATNLQARKQLSELLVVRGQELMVTAAKVRSKLKFHSARACFDEALEVSKDDTNAWICKSICHIHAGELTEAFEAINRAIKTPQESTAEMYILRAKIYWGRGLTEQGNVDIRVAAMMDSTHPEVVSFFNRSFLKAEKLYKESVKAFTEGNYKEALLSVNHAMHITTEDVKLLIMQSKIHRMLGELQAAYDSMLRAKAIFEKAFEGTTYPLELPSDIVLQINLILNDMSIDYASKGNYEKAILLLNKIIKTEEGLSHGGLVKINHKYLVNRGDCHRALNSLSDAVYDYNLALKIKPDDWEIKTRLSLTHYLIGTVHFNQSKFFETQLELDKAIMFNPKVSEYYSVRGRTHYFQSNFQRAYADFKKALELNADNAEVKEWLSQFDDEERSVAGGQNQNSGFSGTSTNPLSRNKKSLRHPDSHANPPRVDFTKVSHTKETSVVRKLEVSEEDMIEMMLLPRKAAQLPTLRMLSTSAQSNRPGGSNAKQSSQKSNSHKESTLPALSSSMRGTEGFAVQAESPLHRTLKASAAVTKKTQNLNKLFKVEREEVDRGPLWQLVETAKALAYAKSHPKHEHRDSRTKTPDAAKVAKESTGKGKSKIKSAGRNL